MKHSPHFKWYILFLACMVTFGGYYSFDYPSVLHNQLRRHFGFEPNEFELSFSLLYSLYSMPNIVIPAFGGALSDFWGNDRVMMVCATLVLLGNVLLLVATITTNWFTMELGRFVFGLGAETLQVCANTTIAKWFDGQELALALALNLSFCKLGGVLTDWLSPFLTEQFGVVASAAAVCLLCALCYALTVHLVFLDTEQERGQEDGRRVAGQGEEGYLLVSRSAVDVGAYGSVPTSEDIEITHSAPPTSTAPISTPPDSPCKAAPTSYVSPGGERLYGGFSALAWVSFALTFVLYGVFVPFNNLSNAILIEVFLGGQAGDLRRKEVLAARLQSIPYMLSVLSTPFLGYAVDRFGFRTLLMLLSTLLLLGAHLFISTQHANPFVPLACIGLAYSIFGSVIWACVPLIVPLAHHGAAYGLMCAFQNAGQAVVPLIVQSRITAGGGQFVRAEDTFVQLSAVGIALSVLLYALDFFWNRNALQTATV